MWNGQDDYFAGPPTADGSIAGTPWDEHPKPGDRHDATSFPERTFDHGAHLDERLQRGAPPPSHLQWISVGQAGGPGPGPATVPSSGFAHAEYPMPLSPTTPGGIIASPTTTAPPGAFGILTPSTSNLTGGGGSSSTGEGDLGDDIMSQAIEEDKRRRNTAASARFRLKKKEREAELERTTKDMNRRCDDLQKRVSELETENRWLRELITERSRNRGLRSRHGISPKGKKAKNARARTKTPEATEKVSGEESSF